MKTPRQACFAGHGSIRSIAPPWHAWVVVSAALVLGVYEHLRSPMGVFLHTPRYWCTGRTHAFALGYGAVLLGATGAAVLVLLGSLLGLPFTRSGVWRAQLNSMVGGSVRYLLVFALAGALTPALELLMPLKVDPLCQARPHAGS